MSPWWCSGAWLAMLLSQPPAPLPSPDPQHLDQLVQRALSAWQVPGVAVAIVSRERILYLKGHGVRQLGRKDPVTPDTLFLLGSGSKPFTSLLLAILVDQGLIHWDDPVRRHLPYFHLSDPLADANVTLRDLLCHRTGLDHHDLLWYRAPWSQEEMIRRVGRLPLSRSFRAAFQYQSILYAAAGHAAAAAAGASWEDLMRQRVLRPLNMKRTTVISAETAQLEDRATPHKRTAAGRIVPLPWYEFPEGNPAGSLCSCARDLAQFLRLQLGNGEYQGQRLVSAESLGETRTPQIVIPVKGVIRDMNPYTLQMSYGLGWVIQDYRGELLQLHGGAIDGFRCQMTLVPRRQLGIAILSNLAETPMNMALTNTLLDDLLGLPAKDWHAHYAALVAANEKAAQAAEAARLARRHLGTRPSRELAAYVGVYEDPAYGACRVTLEKGQLYWHWSSFHCPLEHFHFDTFTAHHEYLVNVQIVFILNADGDIDRLEALGRTFHRQRP